MMTLQLTLNVCHASPKVIQILLLEALFCSVDCMLTLVPLVFKIAI